MQNITLQKKVHHLSKISELLKEREELLEKIERFKNTNQSLTAHSEEYPSQEKKTRHRRLAKEIEKKFTCPYCGKAYGY